MSRARAILQFLDELSNESWVRRSERKAWPKFLFHYTDIRNAVRILQDGCVLSRTQAEGSGRLAVSSGSPLVLGSTSAEVRDSVRLYFRPKTPTQYHCEGIKSRVSLSLSDFPRSHCPVPVFLLFDSGDTLTRADCRFSDGNLGSIGTQLYSTASELRNLSWQYIYHNTAHSRGEKNVIYHKCAEAIVPRQLPLDGLRYIVCRSQAEKEMLLYLVETQTRRRYGRLVLASSSVPFFFRRHTFVERVRLSPARASFQFSPDTGSPGPFQVAVEFRSGQRTLSWELPDYAINVLAPRLILSLKKPMETYTVFLCLDDHVAFANTYADAASVF